MSFEIPGGVKLYTPNNEKTILIAKCDVSGMNKAKADECRLSFEHYLINKFNDLKLNDDTLVIITIPCDTWDIEIYNPKSDNITKEYVEQLLE